MEKKQHPSYGMIRFARSSIGGSGTALFGSSIMHNNVIRLSISKGMMEREGNEDWFLAGTDINDMIVEVEMSYTQFAEASHGLLHPLPGALLSACHCMGMVQRMSHSLL